VPTDEHDHVHVTPILGGSVQLERRVVVLMEPELHEGAKRLAATLGVSVGELVRQAVRARVALDTPPAPAVDDALAFLCAEHDPTFDWATTKAALGGRFDG
jgi:DNA-binding transcriptional regulator YdaS (Cro superfamily)